MGNRGYIPRNPQTSPYYRLVENHYEDLERVWDERYVRRYGYWHGHVRKVKASSVQELPSDARTACIMSIQTFGEQANFNPHIHVVAADGCYLGCGDFLEAWAYDTSALEDAFADAIFPLLAGKGLHGRRIGMMRSWHHSGFQVFRGGQMAADDKEGLERLSRYTVRRPFAIKRLAYEADAGLVHYNGKTTGAAKTYSASGFLAKTTVWISAPREQTARYIGYCSSKSRGMRKKVGASVGNAPEVLPAKKSSVRRARLMAKVYLADPLCCPKCRGQMKTVSFIEEDALIAKILKHAGLWELPYGHSPPAKTPTVQSGTAGGTAAASIPLP